MVAVEKIAVINHSVGGVLTFEVITYGGAKDHDRTPNGLRSSESGDFAINKYQTIDLSDQTIACFPVGTEVWPRVSAELGGSEEAGIHVNYEPNGNTASFEVKGGIWNLSVDGP
jgi:hypothetical protein